MFDNFDFDSLRGIGLTQTILGRTAQIPGTRLMRAVETQRDWFTLHDGVREHSARALHRQPLTIGDWVLVRTDEHGGLWVEHVVDPVTQIARRANDGRRQALASNVDTALLVMGLDADYNPRRMERYLAMVKACDVVPVVVLTKADIGSNAVDKYREVCARLPATVPVLKLNALSGEARREVGPWLHAGQTLVMLGSSGAGKSTLTNTLCDAGQSTGSVRKGDGRGMHTTTARSLHLCPQGACIIDTPGLRTWRPDAVADALAATYEDVQSLAAQCHFRDCRHEDEPGCAVRPVLDPDRLANYKKLLRDAQRGEIQPLARIALRQKWKALGKAGQARAREKRGAMG